MQLETPLVAKKDRFWQMVDQLDQIVNTHCNLLSYCQRFFVCLFFKVGAGMAGGVETGNLFLLMFVIGMETLSCLPNRVKFGGFLPGWKVKGKGSKGMDVSYLFFMWFEALLDLRINLEKSEVILVGRVEDIRELVNEFRCKVVTLPSTYLGLSLVDPFKFVAIWDCFEERF